MLEGVSKRRPGEHGVLHRQDAMAEAVVVAKTALQCPVSASRILWGLLLSYWGVCHCSAPLLYRVTSSKSPIVYPARSQK